MVVTPKVKTALIIGGGLLAYWQYRKAKAAAIETLTTTLNPASQENAIYNLTKNDKGVGLGGWLYGVIN